MSKKDKKISGRVYLTYVFGALIIGAGLFFYQVYVNSGSVLTVTTPEQQNHPGQALSLTVVRTEADKEHGLGDRASLPADSGMLFVFDKPSNYGIWMKDMQFPIDIISLDSNFFITHIEPNVATTSYPTIFYSPSSTKYIVETNAGYAKKSNMKVGDVLDAAEKAVNNR